MAKITEYPEASSFDQGDVILEEQVDPPNPDVPEETES